jgi:hypothetical protein
MSTADLDIVGVEHPEPKIVWPEYDEKAALEAAAIRVQQEAFEGVVDGLIAFYRNIDLKKRVDLKVEVKALYEKVMTLGESVGVARVSVDHLWRGWCEKNTRAVSPEEKKG